MTKLILKAGISLLAASIAAGAQAQTAGPASRESASESGGGLADIVVTAQRREQNVQDVPLAVTAVSQQTLQRQAVSGTLSLVRLIPNLSGGQVTGAGSANNYSLRGLFNSETASTFDTPVGTYIDGIYIARLNASNFALFDVERIEVLRGPQGTLFGRNTTAGAISVILRKPGTELGGFVEGEYGNYDHYQIRGAIDLPVSPTLRTRFAAYKMAEKGYAKNLTTGGSNNDHDGYGFRGAVSADISDAVTWDVSGDYAYDSNENLPVTIRNGRYVTMSGLQKLGSIVTGKKGNIPGNLIGNRTYGVTSNIHIDAAIGAIDFITGYRHLRSRWNVDYFDAPFAIGGFDSVQYSTHKQFSQEVKLTGSTFHDMLDYTLGAFYFHEHNITDYTTVFRLGSGTPFIDADRTLYNDVDSLAGYGQFDLHLTQQVTATAGLRWTTERKDIHYVNNGNPRATAVINDQTIMAAGIPLVQSKSIVTPRFAVQFKPTDDIMLFASATRGFKSGGWNVRGVNAFTTRNFGPETIWSYEAGFRTELFDRRVRFNVTGFYGDLKGLQISTANGAVGATPQFAVGNFSDFESYGVEAELNVVPAKGINLFANAGYDETNYKNVTPSVLAQQANCVASIRAGAAARPSCGNGIIRLDGTLANPLRAPKFTGTIGFDLEIPLSDNWNLVPAASGRYQSKFNTNSAELPTTQDDGFFMLNGSLGIESADRKMQFTVSCENCNNTRYLISVISGRTFYNFPRRYYARARFGF